jgi:cytoskeletal protein CcmA (bactofilin family)
MAESEVQVTVIGRDAKFKGEMSFDHSARILGQFEGKIIAGGEVHVSDGALCKASIDARTVVIDGVVEGDVLARERLQLTSKAKVKGDINAAAFVVQEGASFTGQCRVGPSAAARAPESASSPSSTIPVVADTDIEIKRNRPAAPQAVTSSGSPAWMQVPKPAIA